MVCTPFCSHIKRARESKCTNTEYNIVRVLNNMYHTWLSYLLLLHVDIHDYYVNAGADTGFQTRGGC